MSPSVRDPVCGSELAAKEVEIRRLRARDGSVPWCHKIYLLPSPLICGMV